MKRLKYLLPAALILLWACSNNEEWTPGPEVDKNSVVAYFQSDNSTSYIITPDEFESDPAIKLYLKRIYTQEKVSVPIVVERNDGQARVPATAEFDAGSEIAELRVDISAFERFKTNQLTLRIGEGYSNPYAITDGIDHISCKILVSDWVKVASDVEFVFADQYASVRSDIYHLEGINRFRINRFLGSSLDIEFTIADAQYDNENPTTWEGEFYPQNNCYWDEYGYWWLIDEAADDYASWTIGDKSVDYIEFYPGSSYCNISFKEKKLLLTPYIYMGDETFTTKVTAQWE